MREIEEPRISFRRLIYILGIFILFLSGTVILAVSNRMLLDELLCTLILNFVFLGIFVICLRKSRITGKMGYSGADYSRLFFYLFLGWGLAIAGAYMDDYLMPEGFIAFVFCTYFSEGFALGLGLYYTIVVCLLCGRGTYPIYCYTLILLCDVFLASYLKELKKEQRLMRFMISLTTGCISVFMPMVFYYFTFGRLDRQTFFSVVTEAVALFLFSLFIYPRLIDFNLREKAVTYDILLDEDYPLQKEFKRYSEVEYQHAAKVSRLAAICGREVGADEQICAIGGLYYRIGKMAGAPEIDNALKIASNHCFPPEVVAILEEYEGKRRLPQTRESAIVQMVNALVLKIDLMNSGSNTMSVSWNKDMVIYQTLNEYSNQGFYDESGLTMNQFLRIREKLVQEEMSG